mgnify:CR=1 FL=1
MVMSKSNEEQNIKDNQLLRIPSYDPPTEIFITLVLPNDYVKLEEGQVKEGIVDFEEKKGEDGDIKKVGCDVKTKRIGNTLVGWVFMPERKGRGYKYLVEIKNINGDSPVLAWFQQWENQPDSTNFKKPKVGAALYYTDGVARNDGGFRVIGSHTYKGREAIAVGFKAIIE